MHLKRLGKADSFALQAFEMSAKVEVFAFDVLSAGFADEVELRVEALGVAFPLIGVELEYIAGRKLLAQCSATGIGASSQNKGGNSSGAAVERIPQPVLLFFVLDK